MTPEEREVIMAAEEVFDSMGPVDALPTRLYAAVRALKKVRDGYPDAEDWWWCTDGETEWPVKVYFASGYRSSLTDVPVREMTWCRDPKDPTKAHRCARRTT